MTYPTLSTVNATTDVSNLLVYVNTITNGVAMPLVLLSFFIVVFLAGLFAQMRFKGVVRLDFSFAAAGFSTFGIALIMSLKNGLLDPIYMFISLGIAVLGAALLFLPSRDLG